jgi:endonuclease YncB( thermonuclease family)
MRKKVRSWKKIVVAGALTASVGLGFWASKAFYEVREVIDGDTFISSDGQHVRIDGIDAPELQYCMGNEAKEELQKLILGKKVFIKVRFVDNYKRLIGSVYTLEGNVSEKMLATGLVAYEGNKSLDSKKLLAILNDAKEKEKGIYSLRCTQKTNSENVKCNIKGNIRLSKKYYRYPGCDQYETTLVQLYLGEQWFCSEKEAVQAGFLKGEDCP